MRPSNHSRLRFRSAIRAVCALGVLTLCTCRQAAQEDVLVQAQRLCGRQQWDAAIPLLKGRLLDRPDDAAAHFLLGRCYVAARQAAYTVAEGEFQVALVLFLRNGRVSPLREYSSREFELRCHLEIADVYLHGIKDAMAAGANPTAIHLLIRQCRRVAETARRIAPDSPEVKRLEAMLDRLTRPRTVPRSPTQGSEPEVAI